MLLKTGRTVHNVANLEELKRWTSIALDEVATVVNGNLELISNVRSQVIELNNLPPLEDINVPHSLVKIPTGFIVIGSSAAVSVYNGSIGWTENAISIRVSVTCSIKILVF